MTVVRAEEVKAVMRPYIAFLMDKVNKIYDAWDDGNIILALSRACRLVVFLPRSLKEQLRRDSEAITEAMNATYGIQSGAWYITQVVQTRAAQQVAQAYLKPFVDKMMTLLDERGYLERGRRPIETNVPPEFFDQSSR